MNNGLFNNNFSITLDISKVFSYSLFLSNNSLIKSIKINNLSNKTYEDLKLKINLEDNLIKFKEINISLINSNEIIEINNFDIYVDTFKLKKIEEVKELTLTIELFDKFDNLLGYSYKLIEIYPLNYFNEDYLPLEILSTFINPNDIYVKEIISKSKKELSKLSERKEYYGYKSNDINEVIKEIESIYYAFYKLDLSYIAKNKVISKEKIQSFKEIFKFKKASSLEISLFLISCLEYIGLNTLLILSSNYSLVGIFLNDESLTSTLNDNQNLIYNYSLKSMSKMILIDPSFLTLKKDFIESYEHSLKELKDPSDNFIAIDIHECRIHAYHPIDLDYFNNDLDISSEALSLPNINLNEVNTEVNKNEVIKDKFYIWKKKLLDLSLQNKLVNMKIGTSNIELLINDLNYFGNFLFSNDQELLLIDNGNFSSLTSSKKELIDTSNDILIDLEKDNFHQKRLEVFLDSKEFNSIIPSLYRKSKNDEEETGSNTLFVALGILEYKANKVSKKSNYAPIILYPVEIIKKNNKNYYLKRRDQEPVINTTLLVYLKEEFNIEIDFLNEIPLKNNNTEVDINKIFNTIRNNSLSEGFRILDNAFLGRFSFNKFILWNELNSKKDILLSNPLVRSFVNGYKDKDVISKDIDIDLDKDVSIKNYCIPLSSDSSQIKSIIDSSNKNSYVLIGPPGTGKSQTIANIIINSLYEGKRVLFCSEKKAALDVVYNRLKSLRIDPFCLELHSNKQDKREVLKSFEKVLELGEISSSKEFNDLSSTYDSIKEELTSLEDKIHLPHNYYLSLYDALVSYSKYKDVEGEISLSNDLIDNFNENKYEKISSLFLKAKSFSPSFNKFKEFFPFKILELDSYSKEIKDSLKGDVFKALKQIENFDLLSQKLNKSLKIDSLSDSTIKNLYELFDYLSSHDVYFDLLINSESNELINKLISLINYEKEVKEKEKKFNKLFSKKILDNDLDNYLFRFNQNKSLFFLKKFFESKKLLKEIKSFSINPKEINSKNILDNINYLIDIKKEINRVNKNSLIIESNLKEDYKDNIDLDYILNKLNNTLNVNSKLELISKENLSSFIIAKYIKELKEENASKEMISSYKNDYESVLSTLNYLESTYKFNFNQIDKSSYFNNIILSLRGIYNNIDLINEWTNLINIFNDLEVFGLNDIKEKYYESRIDFDEYFKIFNKSLFKSIVDKLIRENNLNNFIGINVDSLIDEFRKIDNKYKEEVIKEVVSKLSKNVPSSYSSSINSSEVGILKKAIKNNGRGLTLRQLFSEIKETILRITPCILVSPLSCVKYLDPSLYHFDIVIFDEASQLSLSESISVIGRADSFVIAGDDKQLPPTSFFDKQVNNDDEDLKLTDLESLLDDALSLSFKVNKLLFHYRSKDESLIAFSNNKFYENSLYTFPSPSSLESKVSFKLINGIYDSGRSATNKEEAKEVINYLISRIKNNPLNQSFGIITFSVRQMELIQDLLDEEISSDSSLYELIKNLKEDIFIKNLENVQGDERDVILLSICYGRNKNGKFLHNFGPINNTGGYRRLNVAITRSRDEMIVFSSITHNDIDLNKTNSEGVRYLKSFLEYAENGKKALIQSSNEISLIKNGIEYYISKDLELRGYKTKLHLGDSKFKIDIAVLNPITKDSYILGIIIDSYSYYNQLSSKDRNIVEFNVLKSKGWNLIMIWSLDYYDSSKHVIDKIVEEIEKCLNSEKENKIELPSFASIVFDKETKERFNFKKNYASFSFKTPYNERQLLNPYNKETVFSIIKNIIEIESPISKSTLVRRIFEIFQISRKNKSNMEVIDNLINKIKSNITYSYGLPFYFKDSSSIDMSYYRSLYDRKIEEIPKEEVLVAIKEVIKNEISIDKEALKKEVSKLLGFKVKSKKIDEAINESIEYGINEKKIIIINQNNYLELKE